MITGIMQPYFFPYLGYFDLIFRSDVWVVLDITQYTPQTWMNRNRMLHPASGWEYLSLPVQKTTEKQAISTVLLADEKRTYKKLLNKIGHYKKFAPYYTDVVRLVESAFDKKQDNTITALNTSAMSAVCEYLGIPFEPIIASKRRFPLPEITYAGQWALEICTALGADMYINPPGGRSIFRPDAFRERGIRLAFTRVLDFTYPCAPYAFEPRLSILDVLMWNSPDAVLSRLGQDELDYA